MRRGHFHFHGAVIKRSHSSATRGSAMSAAAYQANASLTHEQQRVGQLDLSHRKQLNKGIITDALRKELKTHDILLSADATAVKENRRNWTITDGEQSYRIKEFEERSKNKATGKREVTRRALDCYADTVYDYTGKHDLVESWLQVPTSAAEWMRQIADKGATLNAEDRQRIWAKLEQVEVARDAWPARKISVALPRDLPYEKSRDVLRAFVDQQFTQRGLLADVAIHKVEASDQKQNIHAHILVPIRPLGADGEFATQKHDYKDKGHYWRNKQRFIEWRKAWADIQNDAFKEAGLDVRVSHRSYKKDGIDKQPGVHLGPEASYMENRGEQSRRGDQNRAITEANETSWDYSISAEPKEKAKEGAFFMAKSRGRTSGAGRWPTGSGPQPYTFNANLPHVVQGQPNLGQTIISPDTQKCLVNIGDIAKMGIENKAIKTGAEKSGQEKQAIIATKTLKRPLQTQEHRPEQTKAGWINRTVGAARNLAQQAMKTTRHAFRQTVGRWTGKEQRRAQQQRKETDIER